MGKMAAFGPCQKAAQDKGKVMASASIPEVVDGNGPWQVGGRSLFLAATVPQCHGIRESRATPLAPSLRSVHYKRGPVITPSSQPCHGHQLAWHVCVHAHNTWGLLLSPPR